MSSDKDNLVGQMVEGRYHVESRLGAGGMGAIYIARDVKVLGKIVVIKVLLQEAFQNEYVVKKFRQEAEALSRVDHPNIVQILDYGEMENKQPFLVLQFIDGVSLRTVLKRGGIDLIRTAHLVRQVAYALTAAHEKGILHRDLKPENIMLQTRDGEERAVVIDFGIAQLQNSVIAPKTIVTATAGTISYMSPEQLCAGSLTTASDTYTLGVIAFEMVTGEKPFDPRSPFQLLEMQRAGLSVMPTMLRPDLPPSAQTAIVRALAYEPENRYRTSRDFGNALFSALAGLQHTDADQIHRSVNPASVKTGNINAVGTHHGTAHTTNGDALEAAPTLLNQDAVRPSASANRITPTVFSPPASPPEKRSFLLPAIGMVILVLIAGGGIIGWRLLHPNRNSDPEVRVTPTPTPKGVATPNPISLTYSLTVQKMRNGKPFEKPFQSTGREIFENGWSFRLDISTQKPGYLYLLNEGLDNKGAPLYTVLYPTNEDARLGAQQAVQIPKAPQFYYLLGEAGTEKIWAVWAEKPVPEMEALKGLVNEKDQGEVRDPAQAEKVRSFFAAHASSDVQTDTDKANYQTTIKTNGDMLVYRAELEHH
ncbi:MAG: eukaryotic-like serine/threonine-protein kinase [Blastocatellia bacterium]|jgi:serine/threonine-protein kinase|nr:eukaryotic-like serine/threonine-protein kinase [Blastocatellia bacterium]